MRKASKLIAAWLVLAGSAFAADPAPEPAAAVRAVTPAVVAIRVTAGDGAAAPSASGRVVARQSGFFISADGYAVTRTIHPVDKANAIDVTTGDGKASAARVVAMDDATDLTLVKVEGGPFAFAQLSDAVPGVGDRVFVIGNPPGHGGSVITGSVSALGRDIGNGPYDDFIEIDAPVDAGYSGGPTIDTAGNVVGVTMVERRPEHGPDGLAGFAMPARAVRTILSQLRDHGKVTRGWIGVRVQVVTREVADSLGLQEARGAVVEGTDAGGPAAAAGIEAGDVITAVNGTDIAGLRDLPLAISNLAPGTTAQVTVWRHRQPRTLALTVGTQATD